MAPLLSFAAWIFDLFLGFVSAAMAGWFFLLSPVFRQEAYARWARQPQTLGEIGEGAVGIAGTLALVALAAGTVVVLAGTI